MDVIIACHTEFGRVLPSRKLAFVKDPVGVTEGVAKLVDVASRYGAKITFALCPEAVPYFRLYDGHEVGLHVHPGWQQFQVDGVSYYVGDTYLRKYCKQSTDMTVLPAFPPEEQTRMIEVGKHYIWGRFGITPRTFVAGRWGVNNATVRALITNGMTRDCSAMAHHKEGHYDWSKLKRVNPPYYPSEQDYQARGELPLLMLPISQMVKGGCVNPEVARVYGLVVLKLAFLEYYHKRQSLFHICLHSACMTDAFYAGVMDKFLAFIASHKRIEWKTASEVTA